MSKKSITEKIATKFLTEKLRRMDFEHLSNLMLIQIYDDERHQLPATLNLPATERDISVGYRVIASLSAVQSIANEMKGKKVDFHVEKVGGKRSKK